MGGGAAQMVQRPLPAAYVAPLFVASAVANSAALAYRSAGSLASAVSTAASMCGGTVLRTTDKRSGSLLMTFATMACTLLPVNGASPASISYVIAPSA